jgi:hypothetical protein
MLFGNSGRSQALYTHNGIVGEMAMFRQQPHSFG